jgi:hypothetical protein
VQGEAVGRRREGEAGIEIPNKDCKGGHKFYDDTKKIVDEFTEHSSDMLHSWTSDIADGMNKIFTKFLPKYRTFGMTTENRVRIHLAVCLDSVGYEATYSRLAEKMGLDIGMVTE